jgi:hypothetical protein
LHQLESSGFWRMNSPCIPWTNHRRFRAMKLGKGLGRHRPVDWPPRSLDLSPPDTFLWVYRKYMVYDSRPQRTGILTHNIREEKAKNNIYIYIYTLRAETEYIKYHIHNFIHWTDYRSNTCYRMSLYWVVNIIPPIISKIYIHIIEIICPSLMVTSWTEVDSHSGSSKKLKLQRCYFCSSRLKISQCDGETITIINRNIFPKKIHC